MGNLHSIVRQWGGRRGRQGEISADSRGEENQSEKMVSGSYTQNDQQDSAKEWAMGLKG